MLLLAVTLFIIYKYLSRNFKYWHQRNVEGPTPSPFIGNLWDCITISTSLGDLFQKFHNSSDAPYVGIFTFGEPALVIRDTTIIKRMLQKDFKHFTDRILYPARHDKITHSTLFVQQNREWKLSRTKLSPLFSSGKLKNSFEIIKAISAEMVSYMKINPVQDTQDLFQKFSTEVIVQGFFGINGECFSSECSEIYKQVRVLFDFKLRNALVQSMYYFGRNLINLFKIHFFQDASRTFFRTLVLKCLKNNETLQIKPNNLMSILRDMKITDASVGKFKYLYFLI